MMRAAIGVWLMFGVLGIPIRKEFGLTDVQLSWLAAIARNLATDHLRRAPRVADLPEDLPARSEEQTGALAILAVIRSLPEAYRETLVLRLVEGMTGPEISERTGLTPASVRVNLHRGMKQLRERLERSAPRA